MMGQDWRPNKAISVNLLVLILESADLKVREAPPLCEKRIIGSYSMHRWSFVMCFHFAGAKASYATWPGFTESLPSVEITMW